MTKYQINYNRKFPDHRVRVDHAFQKQLRANVWDYWKFWKSGFNANMVKYFHFQLPWYATIFVGFYAVYAFGGTDSDAQIYNRKQLPAFNYFLGSKRGGYGRYDNIIHKFETQPYGDKDLGFDQ